MRRAVMLTTLVAVSLCPGRARADCMSTYYQTKSPACLDEVLALAARLPEGSGYPDALVGFLAELLRTDPIRRAHLLAAAGPNAQGLLIVALAMAGLPDQAASFAAAHNMTAGYQTFAAHRKPVLTAIQPNAFAGDNDLLIGAFSASGDPRFIRTILANYSTADTTLVHDALRLGLVIQKFGRNPPPGRQTMMVREACRKYACQANPQNMQTMQRLMTLATGFWALRSVGAQDSLIKSTVSTFFDSDPRLARALAAEEAIFSDYLTELTVNAAFKNNPGVNAAMQVYETFGSADAVERAMRTSLRSLQPIGNPAPQ